jgi:hypothetical protein
MREEAINLVKVFSVTKAKEREAIGDKVTAWIVANPTARIVKTVVSLSSDMKFHCFSIVLFAAQAREA